MKGGEEMMQIMKKEEAAKRGLVDQPRHESLRKEQPFNSVKIEHSPEWLEQIRRDIAAGNIPF